MKNGAVKIRVGLGACGIASGGERVLAALKQEADQAGAAGAIKAVGCNGMCHREPMVEVVEAGGRATLYGNVTVEAARRIVRRHIRPSRLFTWARWRVERVADRFARNGRRCDLGDYRLDRQIGPAARYLAGQKRIVLENCGEIDPSSIDDYLARDGYRALSRCVESSSPEQVLAAISNSGLRGRGGAGFPTGRKWELARAHPAAAKYVICNADEGDPRAFMGRLVLESDPHRVLEGLAIAAYAIGATEAYLYVRAERSLAVGRVREAIRQAEERGILGRNMGPKFSLCVEVREGAGALVCGEETALIQSLEGQRAAPGPRPPYPVERGFRGQPTVVNNVETLAAVPWIIRQGPESFAALGTETGRGTKVLALAGKISRAGLIEVPMGVSIHEVVDGMGGGTKSGRPFKAVQLGGPCGGCIPARLADTALDYDALARIGATFGSGSMVVFDDRDCMVDVARLALRSTHTESCGKCTFCRIGTKRMLEILERMCAGKGQPGDIEKLETLANYSSRASLCGLGQAAPSPVITGLQYFRDEYEAHLLGKRCPAGRCRALIRYVVNENCIGCTLCAQVCPTHAIEYRPYEKHEVAVELCTLCDKCWQACQEEAVDIVSVEYDHTDD